MLKLIKFLKKSVFALIFATALLFIQANCDLSLPSYTSDIVNKGILQGGISKAVPTVIRESEMNKLIIFMSNKDKDTVLNHYTLLDKKDLSDKEWDDYLNKYPVLSKEKLYQWDGKEADTLQDKLSLPMTLTLGMNSKNKNSEMIMKNLLAQMPPNSVPKNIDFFTLISKMPKEATANVTSQMKKETKKLPELIVSQSALRYVKTEYKKIGIDVEKLQSDYIILAGLKMLGLTLIGVLASILVTLLASRIAAMMAKDIRSSIFQKVLSFSNTEMDQFSTASLITRSTNDIQQVQMFILMFIRIVIYAPILAIGGIFKVINTNTSMSWILVVGVGSILTLIIILLIVAMPKFKKMQKLVDRINLVMREILTGLPVIRAFHTEEHEKNRFDIANKDLTRNSLFVNRVMTFLMPALMLIMNLVSILITWIGADKINDGTLQVGDMFAFIQYTMQIIMSFLMLTMVSIILPRAAVSAKRIGEVISINPVIYDPKQAEVVPESKKGLLEFKNVSFRYPNAEEDVLSDINFTAEPGKTTAIIGSTGSGKTTMINLIPRFYDSTKGSILIDGVDVTKINQQTLRKKLGFVPQKGVLFSGTIESNIKFGVPDASNEDMLKAARIAQATEFIDAKTEQYQAPISQNGTNVSGGQKQRLSIARAIAKNPEIYIFDDSFSALDYKTDAILRKTLKEELSDKTLIIIAQRISTIMNADQILVLDDGRIVGKGTHRELLTNCEVYQQIASSQLSKEELDHE